MPGIFPILALKVQVPRSPSPRQTSRVGHPKNTPHLVVGEVATCKETEQGRRKKRVRICNQPRPPRAMITFELTSAQGRAAAP